LHLSEALSAELRLAAQRLLRNQAVRPDGARVDLVIDKMRELQHIDVADRRGLLERLANHAVVELRLARAGQPRRLQQRLDLRLARSVEDRSGEPDAALHPGGGADGLRVVQVQKLAERRGACEARLE